MRADAKRSLTMQSSLSADASVDAFISEDATPLLSATSDARPRRHRFTLAVLFAIVFMLNFGLQLVTVPSIRLYEDIVCHRYYDALPEGRGHIGLGETIGEEMCKGEEVQGELNVIFAGLLFLGAIPCLFMTIPYGLVADRIGRKPVLTMAAIGFVLTMVWNLLVMRFWRYMPLRLVWLSPLFTLIGGGEGVGNMVFYAIVSDITPDEKRANTFMRAMSMSLAGDMIAPSVASALMVKSAWIPMLLGLACMTVAASLTLVIPETLKSIAGTSGTTTLASAYAENDVPSKDPASSMITALKSEFSRSITGSLESLSILNSFPVLLLLLGFIVQPFSMQIVYLSVRYVSNRFAWPLREAGFLLSLRALVHILLLLLLIPGLSYWLIHTRAFTAKRKDLVLARISIVISLLGALLIALSPSAPLTVAALIFWTLGIGYVPLVRSLITTLVDAQHIARLYAAIALVEMFGALAAGPSLAALYSLGLRWKGVWVALPYFGLAAVTLVSAVGLWVFGLTVRGSWEKEDLGYGPLARDDAESHATLLGEEDEEE